MTKEQYRQRVIDICVEAVHKITNEVINELEGIYHNMFDQVVTQYYSSYSPREYIRNSPYPGDPRGNFGGAFIFDYTDDGDVFETQDDITMYIDTTKISPHYSVLGQNNYTEEGIAWFALSEGKHSNFPWMVNRGGIRPSWSVCISLPGIGSSSGNPSDAWRAMDKKIGDYYYHLMVQKISNEIIVKLKGLDK